MTARIVSRRRFVIAAIPASAAMVIAPEAEGAPSTQYVVKAPSSKQTIQPLGDITALDIHAAGSGQSSLLTIETPVNTGPSPIFVTDSGSGLLLFQVTHFGDVVTGGLVSTATLRLNGGNAGPVHTSSWSAPNLQDLLNAVFDCTGGPLTFTIAAYAAGSIAFAKKVDSTAHPLTVTTNYGGTIDKGASLSLPNQGSSALLYCYDGTNWLVIGSHHI